MSERLQGVSNHHNFSFWWIISVSFIPPSLNSTGGFKIIFHFKVLFLSHGASKVRVLIKYLKVDLLGPLLKRPLQFSDYNIESIYQCRLTKLELPTLRCSKITGGATDFTNALYDLVAPPSTYLM